MTAENLIFDGDILLHSTGVNHDVYIPKGTRVISGRRKGPRVYDKTYDSYRDEIIPGAFEGQRHIRRIHLPHTVQAIGTRAFAECGRLRAVYLNDGIESIGEGAFMASGIHAVVIPDGIRTLSAEIFMHCRELSFVSLPEGLETIEAKAFYGCTALRSVKLPRSLKRIGDYAFAFCSSLQQMYFPSPLESVGDGVFAACQLLTEPHFPEEFCEDWMRGSAWYNALQISRGHCPDCGAALNSSSGICMNSQCSTNVGKWER